MTDQVGRADGPDLTGRPESPGPGDLEKAEDEAGQSDESPATKDLPRVADRIPNAAWLVMLLTMAERFSFYGMTTPFMNYMQNGRGDPLRPGALGWGQSRASQVSNVFNIISWLTPMASGIVADKGLGRYRTLCLTFVVYLAGTVLLFVSSLESLAPYSAGLFIASLVLIALGMSGANGLMAAFVGDQYTTEDGAVVTTRSGERVVVDRALTLESIYNYYYWCINVGGLSGLATTALELHVGFWAAYLLPLCALSVSAAVLVLGRGRLVLAPTQASALPDARRALWLAVRGGFSLDKARPAHQQQQQQQQLQHSRKVAWTDDFIDELQTALVACRMIFAVWPVLHLCRGQINNNLISQAAQMDTSGIPNDMMYNANPVIIIILMPLVDRFLFPWLRRSGFPLTATTRLTAGFALEALAMAMAAVVQKLVYISPPCYDAPLRCAASNAGATPNAVSVFVQLPVYLLEAMSEILSSPAGWELAFSMAPGSMKSVMQSVFMTTGAVGAGLSIAISPMYKDPEMLFVWASLAIVMAMVTVIFYAVWGRKLR